MAIDGVPIISLVVLSTISTYVNSLPSQHGDNIIDHIPTVTLASRHSNKSFEINKTIYYLTRDEVRSIVLTCKSKIPNRWVWAAVYDIVKSVEVEKEREDVDEIAAFSSSIFIHFEDFNDEVQANFSCTTQMEKEDDSHPTSCVVISQIIENNLTLGPVELTISKVDDLANCTRKRSSAPQDCSRNLVVDTTQQKGVCTLNGEFKSLNCNDIDHCRSLIYLYAANETCEGTSEHIDDSHTNAKALLNGNFPQIVYCASPFLPTWEDYDNWPQFLLLYPSIGTSLMKALNQNSIQLFSPFRENNLKDQVTVTTETHEYAEDENVEFVCKAHLILYMRGLKFKIGTSSSGTVIQGPVRQTVDKNEHVYIVKQSVTLSRKAYGDIQWISCEAPIWNSNDWFSSRMNISLYPSESPTVTLTKLETADSKSVILNCTYRGWPRPIVTWSFSNSVSEQNRTSPSPDVERHNLSWFQLVVIPRWQIVNRPDLNATCSVHNYQGNANATVALWAALDSNSSMNLSNMETFLIIISTILIVAMLVIGTHLMRRKHEQQLTKADIRNFFKGGDSTTSEQVGISAGLNKPYNQCHYELLKSKFKIKEESPLGSGAFGKVCKAMVTNCDGFEGEVAVKMTNVPCPKTSLLGLLSEIKILSYLEKHPNIVDLIGAYTAGLRKGNVYVFLQLCELGSLENYLRKYKPHGNPEEVSLNKEEKNIYVNMPSADNVAFPNIEEWFQADMFRWSTEIANGLEYIASKHIVHMDIATRNILLTSEKQAKITDFGLSRRLYDYQTYVKKSQEPLPWRWMAPESLQKFEFTEKSDVWAFGIALWEIFSLGEIPYQGLSWEMNFATKLERGLRLETPKYGCKNIYTVMLRCWTTQPQRRPTFSELNGLLGKNNSE